MYDKNKIEQLREKYPQGTRICLDHMEDKFAVESGTFGTVQEVDDGGNILMKWDNGRTLSIVPEVDKFHVVKSEQSKTDKKDIKAKKEVEYDD